MPFDWNSGKSAGSFNWDDGKTQDMILPSLPKPKVSMQEIETPLLAKPIMAASRVGTAVKARADQPLVSLPKFEQKPDDSAFTKAAKGAVTGAAETAESLTTPKNLAIMGGIAAGSAIPYVGPLVPPAAGTYFSYEMAKGVVDSIPAAKEAYDKGDWFNLSKLVTGDVLQAMMAKSAIKHGAKAPLEAKMGMAKPTLVAPPPLANPKAQVGMAKWNDVTEVRGTLPNEKPVEMPEQAANTQTAPHKGRLSSAEIDTLLSKAIDNANKQNKEDSAFPSSEYSPDVKLLREMRTREELRGGELSSVVSPVFDRAEQYYQGEAKRISAELSPTSGGDVASVDLSSLPRQTHRRFSSQGGAVALPDIFGKKKTLTPGEQYALAQDAKREAAKKSADGTFLDQLNKWRNAYRRAVNDTTVPLTDALKPLDATAGKGEVPSTIRMNDLIDKKLRSSTIASRLLEQEGVTNLVRDVENLTYLDQYMIAKRAQEIEASGFKTGRDSVADQSLISEFENRIAIPATKTSPALTYADVGQRFTDFNNKLLDRSVQAGIVSKDVANGLRAKYKSYIPIERIQEASEYAHQNARGNAQVASLARQTVLQRLTGSEREIDNSIVATIRRADKVMNQVTRNEAAQYLVDGLGKVDGGTGALVRPKATNENVPSDRVISHFVDGKKLDFVTTPEIAAAAKSLDVKQLGWAVQNIVQPATRLLKVGTTGLSIPFAAVNVIRDILHTAISMRGKQGLSAALDPRIYAKAAKSVLPNSETMAKMEMGGGGFTSFDLSRGQVVPELEMLRAKRGAGDAASYIVAHPVRTVGALFRSAENFLGKSEQFSRARIYETSYRQAIKDGFTPQDAEIMAIHESNNALPNYARAGSIGRVLNSTIPYLNARIQGVRSLTRNMERDPAGTVGKVAAIGTAVAAAAAWNMQDPDRRKMYLDIPEYERRSNILIITDKTKKNAQGRFENIIKIPLAQGLDSLTDVARKSVEDMFGSDPVGFNDLAESLIGAFTPVEPSQISDNLPLNVAAGAVATSLPQVIKPGVQNLANFNFYTGKPIVSPNMEELPPSEQEYPYTSSAAKFVAKKVAPALGIDASPIKTEAFVKDTFGGGAGPILRGADAIVEGVGLMPQQKDHASLDPVDATSRRLLTAQGGAQDNKYYRLRKAAQDILAEREIRAIKQNTDFDGLDRQTQRKLLAQAVGRAKAQVQKIIDSSHIDEAEGQIKVQVMEQVLKNIK